MFPSATVLQAPAFYKEHPIATGHVWSVDELFAEVLKQ